MYVYIYIYTNNVYIYTYYWYVSVYPIDEWPFSYMAIDCPLLGCTNSCFFCSARSRRAVRKSFAMIVRQHKKFLKM